MQNALLRPDEGLYLCSGIECHTIHTLVEACHGLTQFRYTHSGLVAVGVGAVSHLAQCVYGLWRWRLVRTANSQTDDILSLGIEPGHLLEFSGEVILLYLTESVGWFEFFHCFFVFIKKIPLTGR